MNTFLTIALCVIYLSSQILANHTRQYGNETCFLVEMENDYFGLYIEEGDAIAPKHYHGVCDLETLAKWEPCPFKNTKPVCYPSGAQIEKKSCIRKTVLDQRDCNCSGVLNCRQLQQIPNFPTCFLGERLKTGKRAVEAAPVINNCIWCIAKHPNVGLGRVGSLERRRVKRGERTPSSLANRLEAIKRRKLFDWNHSRVGSCLFSRKYRGYVPTAVKNTVRIFSAEKLSDSDAEFEKHDNFVLDKILRSTFPQRKLVKRQKEEEQIDDDDDDDEDDDNAGEDIAIIEEPETEEPTTEMDEKEELVQNQHEELENYNFTKDMSEDKVEKQGGSSDSYALSINLYLIVMCTIYTVEFYILL